jgi:hypothetical protein
MKSRLESGFPALVIESKIVICYMSCLLLKKNYFNQSLTIINIGRKI